MDDSSVKLKVMKEKQFNMELGQGMRQMNGRKDLMEDIVMGGEGITRQIHREQRDWQPDREGDEQHWHHPQLVEDLFPEWKSLLDKSMKRSEFNRLAGKVM